MRRADERSSGDSAFMLISGITSAAELCVTVESGLTALNGAALVVEPCMAALAAADGRELWSFRGNGQLLNVAGKKCAGISGDNESGAPRVVLQECTSAGVETWEALANGQLRYGTAGTHCLSQRGATADETNVALGAAVVASSTLEASGHGANSILDGRDATFWASAFDTVEPVVLTIDLGIHAHLMSAEIVWEYPAQDFSVSISEDGERWSEVFSTDTNIVKVTSFRLDSSPAKLVRLTLRATHPVHGTSNGRRLYGIRSFSLFALGMHSVIDVCDDAAKSADARDKYFSVEVASFDMSAAEALKSELPSLAASHTSLAASASELVALASHLGDCTSAFSIARANASVHVPVFTHDAAKRGVSFQDVSSAARERVSVLSAMQSAHSDARAWVDVQQGVDASSVANALAEAREAVLAMRTALL